jgi:hypothetical protein
MGCRYNERSSQGYQHYGLPRRDDAKVGIWISLRRPGFYPGPVHEGFLMDNVAIEQVLSEVFSITPPVLHTFHSSTINTNLRNCQLL